MIGNKFLSVAGSTAALDAQFNYVTMLLHGDGTNGAQNNTFLDSSTNNFTITRNGNTTQGSFSPYGSNWGNYFNGTSAYLAAPSNSAFTLGTGDFTIEMWYNPSISYASGNGYLFDMGSNGTRIQLYLNTVYFLPVAGNSIQSATGVGMTVGQWTHVAAVRSGSTMTLYVNGTSVGSTTNSSNLTDTLFRIGSAGYTGDYFTGYISNVRVVKGTAVYTGSFTPSTTPLTAVSGTSLLTCQSNRFVDNSTNNFSLTIGGTPSVQRFNPFGASTAYSTSVIGGSGYFDGTGDYLSVADNTALDLSTGDFTIECWVYPFSTIADLDGLITKRSQSTFSGNDWRIAYRTSGTKFAIATGTDNTDRSTPAVNLNAWNHIAFVRSSGTLSCYANGVRGDNVSWSSNLDNAENLLIALNTSGYDLPGYISDVRIVKGSAVYSGATYTVPTTPLTAITNTSLLTSMTNGAIFDNAMMNDLETVGNAQISTSVKKYGTGSLAFDGTGDYLAGPYSPNLDFGTGDFTVELWFYFNGSVTGAGFIGSKNIGGMDFAFTSSSLRIGRINTAWDSTFSWSPSANTWYHIAFTRSNGTARAFVNGTQVGSDSSNTNNYYPNGGIYVGVSAPPDRYVNGYIDDLRITKGYARYTTTFTPPTKAFSDTGPY